MAIRQTLPPLPASTPLIDPKTGFPTLAFSRWWQQITQNSDTAFGEIDDTTAALATKVPASRLINTTAPIAGGGDLSADRTLTHADTAVTPGSYTNTNLTVDQKGHITAASSGSVAGSLSGALVRKSADQTAANFTSETYLSWDSEDYDVGGFHPRASTVTMTIASPGVVTWTAHGFAAGSPIVFTATGALPTGLTAGTTYYVVSPAANTFQVSATVGGSAINTTGSQSGTHTATNYSRLTVQANGYVRLYGQVRMASVAASEWILLRIFKNGSVSGTSVIALQRATTGTSTNPSLSLSSPPVAVVAGDYFEIGLTVQADTSTDITAVQSHFAIEVVG